MTDEYGNVLSYHPLRRVCDKPEIVFNQVRTLWPKEKKENEKILGSPSAQRRKRKA